MPSKKNQHFVPRFLLRRWAVKDEEKIRMVHLKSRRIIPEAAISGQCSKDWMYGKDIRIEDHFGGMEGNAQIAIEHFSKTREVPDHLCGFKTAVLIFMLMQVARTEAAFLTQERMAKAAFTEVFGENLPAELEELLNKQTYEEKVRLFLSTSAPNLPFLYDLAFRVLEAQADAEFIISDNPCILTNQLFHKRLRFSSLGWSMSGLQVFLPIDPKTTIMLYDRRIYKVGSRSDGFRVSLNASDVETLNRIQVLNGLHSIYISPMFSENRVQSLLSFAMPRKIEGFKIQEIPGGENNSLIATSRTDLNIPLEWAFCSILKKSRYLAALEYWGPRDKEFARRHRDIFGKQIKNENQFRTVMWNMIQYQLERWKCF